MNLLLRVLPAVLWFVLCCLVGMLDVLVRGTDLSNGHRFARLNSWGALRILGIRAVLKGTENLTAHQPCVYLANHQSYLDVLVHGAVYPPRTLLIAKKQILRIPFFGLMYFGMGNLLIDRDRQESAIRQMQRAAEVVRARQVSIWIFPEGKRKGAGEMLPFKKGGFHLAVEAGVPIVPIATSRLSKVVDLGRLRLAGGEVEVRVLDPVHPRDYGPDRVDDLVAEVRRRMEEALAEMNGAP